MRRLPIKALVMAGAIAAAPATPAKFTMMRTWNSGTSTRIGKEQIEVGDKLDARDRSWCNGLLKIANASEFARKPLDAQRHFYLPSGFRLTRWTPIAKPEMVATPQATASYNLLPVFYQEMDDCGKPTRKGRLNADCRLDTATVSLKSGGTAKLLRMTLIFSNNPKNPPPFTQYFVLDSQGRIYRSLNILADEGQSAFISIDGRDIAVSWGTEDFDFSSGYGGARFRHAKVTLNFSLLQTLMEKDDVDAFRHCVLALAPTARP